ncbi:hypothetical protein [Mesorhizobium sp. A556]
MSGSLKAVLVTVVLCVTGTLAIAQPVFEEDGPFRSGEGFGTTATCETIGDWIDRVPDYDGRITMVIKGSIEESHWDGALAYLIMCKPEGIQIMCVTYAQRKASREIVLFAGGYSRVGERQIMLDPCLIYPVD